MDCDGQSRVWSSDEVTRAPGYRGRVPLRRSSIRRVLRGSGPTGQRRVGEPATERRDRTGLTHREYSGEEDLDCTGSASDDAGHVPGTPSDTSMLAVQWPVMRSGQRREKDARCRKRGPAGGKHVCYLCGRASPPPGGENRRGVGLRLMAVLLAHGPWPWALCRRAGCSYSTVAPDRAQSQQARTDPNVLGRRLCPDWVVSSLT